MANAAVIAAIGGLLPLAMGWAGRRLAGRRSPGLAHSTRSFGEILAQPATRLAKGRALPFAWTSPIDHKSTTQFTHIASFHFEIAMMLHVLAGAHANRARELMASVEPDDVDDFDEKAKAAAEHIRTAAGLFDYLAKKALLRWKNPPPEAPYECNVVVCGALRNLCLSMGQALVVKKAKLHTTSQSTVAKLSVGGFREAEAAFKAVINMRDTKCISDAFKDFLHAHVVVHKTNALRALGEAQCK